MSETTSISNRNLALIASGLKWMFLLMHPGPWIIADQMHSLEIRGFELKNGILNNLTFCAIRLIVYVAPLLLIEAILFLISFPNAFSTEDYINLSSFRVGFLSSIPYFFLELLATGVYLEALNQLLSHAIFDENDSTKRVRAILLPLMGGTIFALNSIAIYNPIFIPIAFANSAGLVYLGRILTDRLIQKMNHEPEKIKAMRANGAGLTHACVVIFLPVCLAPLLVFMDNAFVSMSDYRILFAHAFIALISTIPGFIAAILVQYSGIWLRILKSPRKHSIVGGLVYSFLPALFMIQYVNLQYYASSYIDSVYGIVFAVSLSVILPILYYSSCLNFIPANQNKLTEGDEFTRTSRLSDFCVVVLFGSILSGIGIYVSSHVPVFNWDYYQYYSFVSVGFGYYDIVLGFGQGYDKTGISVLGIIVPLIIAIALYQVTNERAPNFEFYAILLGLIVQIAFCEHTSLGPRATIWSLLFLTIPLLLTAAVVSNKGVEHSIVITLRSAFAASLLGEVILFLTVGLKYGFGNQVAGGFGYWSLSWQSGVFAVPVIAVLSYMYKNYVREVDVLNSIGDAPKHMRSWFRNRLSTNRKIGIIIVIILISSVAIVRPRIPAPITVQTVGTRSYECMDGVGNRIYLASGSTLYYIRTSTSNPSSYHYEYLGSWINDIEVLPNATSSDPHGHFYVAADNLTSLKREGYNTTLVNIQEQSLAVNESFNMLACSSNGSIIYARGWYSDIWCINTLASFAFRLQFNTTYSDNPNFMTVCGEDLVVGLDSGFVVYRTQSGGWDSPNTEDLADVQVFDAELLEGNLYMASSKGILIYDLQNLTTRGTKGPEDGFPSWVMRSIEYSNRVEKFIVGTDVGVCMYDHRLSEVEYIAESSTLVSGYDYIKDTYTVPGTDTLKIFVLTAYSELFQIIIDYNLLRSDLLPLFDFMREQAVNIVVSAVTAFAGSWTIYYLHERRKKREDSEERS